MRFLKMTSHRKYFALFVFTSLNFLFYFWLEFNDVDHSLLPFKQQVFSNPNDYENSSESNETIEWDVCRLPKIDPWNSAVSKFFKRLSEKRSCKREFFEFTQLSNGTIKLHHNSNCKFRCLYPVTDFQFRSSDWQQLDYQGQHSKAECDIVEVQCNYMLFFTHNYLQIQIYEGTHSRVKLRNGSINPSDIGIHRVAELPPDVHLLIIDSTSHAHFRRSLPKTLKRLNKMGAIPFPHLNKVGENSQSNAYALFFGIQPTPIEPNPMRPEGYQPPRPLSEMGKLSLNDEPFISFSFKRSGYRTMMAEDWYSGVFNEYPDGKGFDKGQPTDHYMRPFQLRIFEYDHELANKMLYQNCLDHHQYILKYLAQFVNAYKGQPKFSISWAALLTHENLDGLQKMDGDLAQFLMENKELSNAFLMVMSDHGHRRDKYRETHEGVLEDNNPALFIVLPQKLRQNDELVDVLRRNARQLVSQFDVHATLEHIAQHGFDLLNGTSPALELNIFGQSLFTPFNTTGGPRHCGTLGIPMEYCQCQFQRRDVTSQQQSLGRRLAEAIVEKMNGDIVTFDTVPGNGCFQGYCQLLNAELPTEKIAIISQRIMRLNNYGQMAVKCARNAEIVPYCTCKINE